MRALRKLTKNPEASPQSYVNYKKERAIYRRKIQEAKKEAWSTFCKNTKNPYGKLKKVAFEDFYNQESYALSSSKATIQTKQNLFKELTTNIFGKSEKPTPSNYIPDPSVPDLTTQELTTALMSFNKNKAPGIDEIDHIILRNLLKSQQHLLLKMYNSLLHLNYFPEPWKIGEAVYFLKKGKPPEETSSYRPITLLPVFGKVLEKIVLRRINYELEQKNRHLQLSTRLPRREVN